MTDTANEERNLHPAQIKKLEAETWKLTQEAESARYAAEGARLQSLYGATYRELETGLFRFTSSVTDGTVQLVQEELFAFHAQHPGEPVKIEFNSPGGSVFAGFALFNDIRALSRNGHHVTTHANGIAASMASILWQAGDYRTVGEHTQVMLHEVSTGALGKTSEIQDVAKLADRLTQRAADIYAARGNLSAQEFRERMERRDYWIDAQECLEIGLADEIV